MDIYDLIIAAIEKGEFPPGERLREDHLAVRFGVSRTPIREALRRLEAQGLVTHEPRRGAVVSQLSYNQINELYYVCEVLEGAAARLAALHASDVEIAVLRAMLTPPAEVMDDPAERTKHFRKFHRQIYLISRNRYLMDLRDNMRSSLTILAGTTSTAPRTDDHTLQEHTDLVEAIAARDPDAAEQAARRHMRAALKSRLELIAS